MLQAQHELHQFGLRKPLEFLLIPRQDDSHTGRLGKGVSSYHESATNGAPWLFKCLIFNSYWHRRDSANFDFFAESAIFVGALHLKFQVIDRAQ